MCSIADEAITGREVNCRSPSHRSLKPPIRADCVRWSCTKLSAQLLPLQGQLLWCDASSCSAKASPAFIPSAGDQDVNVLNMRCAPHDSHSILSMSTLTQPLRAQAKELAACNTSQVVGLYVASRRSKSPRSHGLHDGAESKAVPVASKL
ncbi:Os03g0785401 [Oryza sativa Japonica Group]|uniref:Os03g0785401 protein n=1 Tax=Oryza sativa subsp. japonica TaxID=39947 RepID=A0A0P0W3W5_ORYSJ|nr:Os03g0785401 [Oryza sativa Japonica Group]